MDGKRLDKLARDYATTHSRRTFLRTVFAGGVAGVGSRFFKEIDTEADAARRCGRRACIADAEANLKKELEVCENLMMACMENCNPYECAGCTAWAAKCRIEVRQAFNQARQQCRESSASCGDCEVCENDICVPKTCSHSCDVCNPATGACEPKACGPCEVCIGGTCTPQCSGCQTCFQGECVEQCPSCTECDGSTC